MRTLKLILTEDSGEIGPCNVPITSSVSKEITDGEIKSVTFGKPFDLMTEIKNLSNRLDEQTRS